MEKFNKIEGGLVSKNMWFAIADYRFSGSTCAINKTTVVPLM